MLCQLWAAAIAEFPTLVSGALLLLFGWFVGQRLTNKWGIVQKARELDLAAMSEFHLLYGEFFAVWKLWNAREDGKVAPSEIPKGLQWALLDRAATAEGKVEAILVRIASTKILTNADIEALGRFRQLYQQLRESIGSNLPIPWTSSQHADYLKFKELAPYVASLIRKDSGSPSSLIAASAIAQITDNKWEGRRRPTPASAAS